jgi:hypothetical protein
MILAHIAGLPVEEALLALAPVCACGAGLVAYSTRSRLRGWWRRRGISGREKTTDL